MIRIKEAILVEGRYDVNVVRQLVDTVVLETGGFRIFNNKEKLQMLRRIAQTRGLIILTDSDGAGFVIRNYLKGAIPQNQLKQAYIPDIYGKEKRKRQASREGKLGVEGMQGSIILQALYDAGATVIDESAPQISSRESPITKADFFQWGISGGPNSAYVRRNLLRQLQLPDHMTANALLQYINAVSSRPEVESILNSMDSVDKKESISYNKGRQK